MNTLTDDGPGTYGFTLHVGFLAADAREAQLRAERYVRALNQVCPEVDCFTARVSAEEHGLRATAVFCGSPGPDETDVCIDSAGHPGWHNGPGMSRSWRDGDVSAGR